MKLCAPRFYASLCLMFLLAACGGGGDGAGSATAARITGINWHRAAAHVSPDYAYGKAKKTSDLCTVMDSTQADDLLFFYPNGRVVGLEGATKRDDRDPDVFYDEKWHLEGNTLTMGDAVYQLLQADGAKLVTRTTFTENGVRYQLTESYVPEGQQTAAAK